MTPSTLGARLGIAAAGAMVLGFGGLSAAALTGSLPDAAQHVIRPVGGVPADDDTDTQTAGDTQDGTEVAGEDAGEDQGRTNPTGAPTSAPTTAVGPDATGPAAFGLCTAYTHGKADGKTADQSVAFRNLVTAAGGKDKVEAYCAAVKHPSAHATGKATHPSADDRAGSKPGSHPTGKPDSTTGNTHRATPHGKPSGTGTGTVAPRP